MPISLSRIQAAITAAIFLVALLCLGIQTARIEGFKIWPISVKGYKAKNAEMAAQLKAVVAAEREATAKNKADVAAKEANSQRISDNAKSAYQTDLARLRADNQRLRAHPQGSAGKPGVSKNGPTAEGTDGADQLPLPPEELLRAQEIELQLMHLQRWVSEQLAAQ